MIQGGILKQPSRTEKAFPNEQPEVNANIGTKSATCGKETDDLVEKKDKGHENIWTNLLGRANEEQIFINGQPVTSLLDTGSQVTHVSLDFCLANGIQIHPIQSISKY